MLKKNRNLPKNAKRVFEGVIFEVWQWKQKMFDGSFETFEKLKRADTVNIIGTVGEKIIVLRQKQPDWEEYKVAVPGGRVDKGETPLQAAKRELFEETGYVSDNWILWKKRNPYGKMIWTVYNFIARDCKYIRKPATDAGERIKTRIVNFKEFLMFSERPDFHEGELKYSLLRARHDRKYRKGFKKLLFG